MRFAGLFVVTWIDPFQYHTAAAPTPSDAELLTETSSMCDSEDSVEIDGDESVSWH